MNITVKTITAKKELRLETKILRPARQTTAIIAARPIAFSHQLTFIVMFFSSCLGVVLNCSSLPRALFINDSVNNLPGLLESSASFIIRDIFLSDSVEESQYNILSFFLFIIYYPSLRRDTIRLSSPRRDIRARYSKLCTAFSEILICAAMSRAGRPSIYLAQPSVCGSDRRPSGASR